MPDRSPRCHGYGGHRPLALTCVVSSLAAGGAERSMAWLSAGLAARGHTVTLLTIAAPDADFFAVGAGVRRVIAPTAAGSSCRWYNLPAQRRRLASLHQALLETRPELVISFTDTLNVQVLDALRGDPVPVIVAERTNPQLHEIGWRWRTLRRLAYPRAARVVVQTEQTARWARGRTPHWRVAVIANAVQRPPAGKRCRHPVFGERNLVTMGRLGPEKGYDDLIRAFAALVPRHPQWHLTIFGEGDERAALEALVAAKGLAGRVHLPGRIAEPWAYLRDADLYVLSSRFEGFPNALAEAMACGLPAVSVDCATGPREILRHEIDGLLVPPCDPQALAAALDRLMGDDAERVRFAGRAPEVCERFAEAAVLDRWCALIDETLGRNHAV